MDRMVACVLITGGTIDKFIGDAVMAHWGAVGASDPAKDALSGVSAALMMRVSLMNFNKGRGDSDKNPIIRIGAGLNSGSVVAGQIGSKERVVFTVIGDAVSMADRTETFNKSFGTDILITENTYKLVGEYLITEEMAEVKIRGGKTAKIYSVVNTNNDELAETLIANLDKFQNTDREITRRCIGINGPKNLDELRNLIGISAPNLTNFNLEEAEKKIVAIRLLPPIASLPSCDKRAISLFVNISKFSRT
jgi:adenylate cyclase